MPEVTLPKDPATGQCVIELPGCCMRCERPATVTLPQHWWWHPPWVWALLVVGGLPAVLLAIALTTRTIRFPARFCDHHVRHWSSRKLTAFIMWSGFAMVLVAALLATAWDLPIAGNLLGVAMFWLLLGIGVTIRMAATEIQVDWADANSFRLKRVSEGFAAAVAARVCQKCLYDLTGNASGRCPECGTPTPLPSPESATTHVKQTPHR